MTRPIPMSDIAATDLLVEAIARRQPHGDDPVAGLLAALADHADRPLGSSPRRRRSQRHRLFTGLAALAIGASGAGVAAAVGIPDGPPDLPPRVAPSRVHHPAPSLPGATFGLDGRTALQRINPIVVLTPDGTRITSLYVPAVWGPVASSQTVAGRSPASELSRSRGSDLALPPASSGTVDEQQPAPAAPDAGQPERKGVVRRAEASPRVAQHPKSGVAKPAPDPVDATGEMALLTAPAQAKGKSQQAPGQLQPAPGQAKAEAPGQLQPAPGQAKAEAPGQSQPAPGQAKPEAPGQAGSEAPGQPQQPPCHAKADGPGPVERSDGDHAPGQPPLPQAPLEGDHEPAGPSVPAVAEHAPEAPAQQAPDTPATAPAPAPVPPPAAAVQADSLVAEAG